jgi:two-component system, chemotaxis family, chemotaxis protein CheY
MRRAKPLSLLIVDDNAYMRTIVTIVARAAGIAEVDEADSGPAALEMLRRRKYTALTVDLKMEPLDGVEFVRMLRRSADSPDPSAAVIVISAYSERSRVIAARDAGADEFLTKPLTVKDFLNRLESVIHNRRPFVRTPSYFGPDRRRVNDPLYLGPWRRKDDRAGARGTEILES